MPWWNIFTSLRREISGIDAGFTYFAHSSYTSTGGCLVNDEARQKQNLDSIVEGVVAEAHIPRDLVLPEEISYIREHVLKRPLKVAHIWALGVGVVITGAYFGWNFGLPVGGPLGVLIASLIVCVLYLAWVLALSELSVAMPFGGGPMAYGRRAIGKWFGFLMGWSMFL